MEDLSSQHTSRSGMRQEQELASSQMRKSSDPFDLHQESLFEAEAPETSTSDAITELIETSPAIETSFLKKAILRPIGKAIDWSLDRIATDPNAEASFTRMLGKLGIDFVPWAGPIKKMADARAEAKTGDPEKVARGRTLFAIAAAELAFDTATLGGSFFLPYEEGATGLRTIKDTMRRSRIFRGAAFLVPDVLTWGTTLLMKSSFLSRNIDRVYLAGIATASPENSGANSATRETDNVPSAKH
jgi:hypothetical protein